MLAAAIPIYNERRAITLVIAAVRPFVDRILVVDDGSTDGSGGLAAEAGAEIASHRRNRGKGASLQTALSWTKARADISELILIDGDGQHDPADIPEMVAELRQRQLDILVGSRFLGRHNAPLYRLFGLHVLTACAGLGSGIYTTDSQSGFRVMSRKAIERLELTENAFAAESEMQFAAAANGLRVGERPIAISYAGPARRSPVVHGVSVLLRTILMTSRHRPLRLPLLLATPFLAMRIGRTRSASVTATDG